MDSHRLLIRPLSWNGNIMNQSSFFRWVFGKLGFLNTDYYFFFGLIVQTSDDGTAVAPRIQSIQSILGWDTELWVCEGEWMWMNVVDCYDLVAPCSLCISVAVEPWVTNWVGPPITRKKRGGGVKQKYTANQQNPFGNTVRQSPAT